MEVKFKKLKPQAILPRYSHSDDAGADLFSCEEKILAPGERYLCYLGLASEFDQEYVALVWDKGGPAANAGVTMLAGVIDANYRGEWIIVMLNTSDKPYEIKQGQKVAQVLFQKVEHPTFIEAELNQTARGEGRQGSTGLF